MKLFQEYGPDVYVPWWMGVVRKYYYRTAVLSAPVPISVICRVAIAFWSWLREPLFETRQEAVNEAVAREERRIRAILAGQDIEFDDNWTVRRLFGVTKDRWTDTYSITIDC
jgi:hypothetical protein